ncbi:hypothetical protein [Sulfurimonas sp.]|nr:hypothetical protein [Sulfurimonas sp.]
MGRNSYGTIIDIEAITEEKIIEFKQVNIKRKVEVAYPLGSSF